MFRLPAFARLFLLFLTAVTPITAQVPVVPVSGSRAELERETFALINEYRNEHHLPDLIWNAEIAQVARVHSRDMAAGDVDFGHDGFSGRIHRLRGSFPGLHGAGENVLMTDDPGEVARKAVALWLDSPPHLHNIRGDFNASGIGVSINKEGVIYFTQIFVKLQVSTDEVEAEPAPRVTTPFGFISTSSPRTTP